MYPLLTGDIGSTGGHWAWLSQDREITFTTRGYNPLMHDETLLTQMLDEVESHLPGPVKQVVYYGTGIISDSVRAQITGSLHRRFGEMPVECQSDMLASARAVLQGAGESVVCILGTGSNSCLFDGSHILQQIPSLGFPLGDEGSGADIGRSMVRLYYYGMLPAGIHAEMSAILPADRRAFLELYRHHPAGNRFLAELVPIAAQHRHSSPIAQMLRECFRTFARLHVAPYGIDGPVHMTGGIASVFREEITEVLKEEALVPGVFLKNPISGIIAFHRQRTI